MATRVKKVNQWYIKYALEHLVLEMDDSTLYCGVLSENVEGVSYRVTLDEGTMVATSCNCPSYKRCKHMDICDTAFAGYTAPVAPETVEVVESASQEEEPKITEIEANNFYIVNSNTQVWRAEEGEWMAVGPTENAIEIVEALLEKQQAVAEAERLVAAPVVEQPALSVVSPEQSYTMPDALLAKLAGKPEPTPLKRDMLDAPLTSNSGFQLLKLVS